MKDFAFAPLNKAGYDPFIDYLKGVAIIFVVLTHCLPKQEFLLFSLWGALAVPLFLLIQVFHSYKKGLEYTNIDWKKIFKRIIKPFMIMLVISFCLKMILSDDTASRINLVKSTIASGGIGPGSYYIWIYLEFSILIPIVGAFIKWLERIFTTSQIVLLFIIIAELLEILCSYSDINNQLYRLLFFRYFYLIPLGYQIAKWGG